MYERRLLIVLDDAADEAQVRPAPSQRSGVQVYRHIAPESGRVDGQVPLDGRPSLDRRRVGLLAEIAGSERIGRVVVAAESIAELSICRSRSASPVLAWRRTRRGASGSWRSY
ncbi:hypothetical protein [Tenggerimyces flavus]|uniref:Uncharacterized protein n=1 Tax=Tenggerimyces flavus TaxID=1708749 RepID=A0ABV7YQR4_9ACTN|nr:hypothetical protein [Tenggerimyces flavus]MBM7790260.1 hypothetical protein [Tenggerimyces flavus]